MAGELVGAGTEAEERAVQHPAGRLLDAAWSFLRSPWLAALVAALLLAMLVLARVIPQVPGQTAEDPAAAVRWLNAERDRWGSAGDLMAAFGFFGVSSSPLYYVLVAALGLLASVHLADAVRAARAVARLPRLLASAPPGAPIETGWPFLLHRLRRSRPSSVEAELPAAELFLRSRFGAAVHHNAAAPDGNPEVRLASVRRAWAAPLRVLLPLGTLLAVIGLWANSVWGWSFETPEMAPGDTFSVEARGIVVTYAAQASNAPHGAKVEYQQGSDRPPLAIEGTAFIPWWTSAAVTAGSPALLLTAPNPVLARPDDTEPRGAVGLLFPQVGSEQVVVLPDAGAGMRIVRLPADAGLRYLVEIFAPDQVEPVERAEIAADTELMLPTRGGEIPLQLHSTQGVVVSAVHQPLAVLLWAGLVLALFGSAGWLLRSGFAVMQLRAWPESRSELTLQSTEKALITSFEQAAS